MAIKNISYCPDYSKLSTRLKYGDRINHGHKFERDLRALLANYGIVTSPTGRDLLSPEFQSGLNQLNDPTSKFLRYFPDLAGRLPNRGGSFLIEAKSVLTTSGNYSINLASYVTQRDLVLNSNPLNSLKILYIFPPPIRGEDYKAEWVQTLHRAIIRQVSEQELLMTVRGSRRPYALLASNRLRPLSTVLRELIDPNHDQRVGDERVFKMEEYVNGLYGR